LAWLFLLAYTCSGLAGLVYQVSWTRLLTLYLGHSTAAASSVVAAFLGGLALGAAIGGRVAPGLRPGQALIGYALLEVAVGIFAFVLPYELNGLTPILRWAYADGSPGALFSAVRVASCVVLVLVPATALGATFPLAIRWFASDAVNRAWSTSLLYTLNTIGAAAGALLAGFWLIPTFGLSGTTIVAIAGSGIAACAAGALVWSHSSLRRRRISNVDTDVVPARNNRGKKLPPSALAATEGSDPRSLVPMVALGISGFAALTHEIAWTRVLTLVLGPTIYAFAATLAAVILGIAVGSGLGAVLVARSRHVAVWLSLTLTVAAATASLTSALAGGAVPRLVARQVASGLTFDQMLIQGLFLAAALILPTTMCLGAAFPLALRLIDDPLRAAERRFSVLYSLNTIGAVLGSLTAGFVLIPRLGLQHTMTVVSLGLVIAALVVAVWAGLTSADRMRSLLASGLATLIIALSPSWDRALLASGVYLYAPFVPKDLDLETQLKAGTLLYYGEGAVATVSVKRLTGTTTLAVDGKTDASNRGDMLTQKLIAHLPLLLHENPRDVAIVGLGSGVTVGSALRHPISRADVIELSREVVEASQHFVFENHDALRDPRTHLIVGDGRSHLVLSSRQYDVVISEPSNPWIAGVASLFTREFFQTVRDRLAPGGIVCQWANTYNISDADLRAVVATFRSVFPDATAWLVGGDDLLLLASNAPIGPRLNHIERHWARHGVAVDLALVGAVEPFAIWSLFVGGPEELARYATGSSILTDDRMSLEFSAPREIHRRDGAGNIAALAPPASEGGIQGPAIVRNAIASATAAQWRNRGLMMAKRDAHTTAFNDYVRALTLDPSDVQALDGFVRSAVLMRRAGDALSEFTTLTADRSLAPLTLVARSKLLAATGSAEEALEVARRASRAEPVITEALEQVATLLADAGDTVRLDATVEGLRQIAPHKASSSYFAAVSAFLRGRADEAVTLAEEAIALDPSFAPVYDLLGAAKTKLGQNHAARAAFETSLRFDSHDSTAYTNLGLLELAGGNRDSARNYFAEALWLNPDSTTAREGLRRASQR
jgi:spermidine synthase